MWKVKRMKTAPLIARALSFVAVSALILNPALSPALATDYRVASANTAQADLLNARSLTLGISKSLVVDLPRDVKDVLVADTKIANAVVRSSRRAYIIGVAVGQTNVFFFEAEGRQMACFDIAVTRDLNGIRAAIRAVIPYCDIRVEGIGDGVVLSGTASSAADAQQAFDIAARLIGVATVEAVGQGTKIVNAITIRGRDQIMLK